MRNSCGIEARAAKVLCTWFFAAAAVTMAGCGGGDTDSNLPPSGSAGPSSAISATPVADTASGNMPLTVTFSATNPKGSISKYEWNMRDNSPMKEGQQVQHTFMEPGSYDVTLTVRDAAGRYNNASLMVTVGGGGGGTVCQPAPELFTNNVWPALNGTCLLCHATGRVAAGTGLVFVLGGTTEQNYNVLRTYASTKADVLLGKTIGLPTHDGGMPFVNANSQQYKDLAALIPVMASSCTTAPPGSRRRPRFRRRCWAVLGRRYLPERCEDAGQGLDNFRRPQPDADRVRRCAIGRPSEAAPDDPRLHGRSGLRRLPQ
jgi:hypothetical protein